MPKDIVVVIPGAGDEQEARDLTIKSGTKAREIIEAIELDPQNYQLQIKRGDDYEVIANNENCYKKVESGDKLFATPTEMVVG